MRQQASWEKTPTPGLYRKLNPGGGGSYGYRFRRRGETNWTPNYELENYTHAKQWFHEQSGQRRSRKLQPSKLPFLEYATNWIESSTTTVLSSRTNYTRNLKCNLQGLHKLKLHEIDGDVLRGVIQEMRDRDLEPGTIATALVPARACLTSAKARNHIASNPFDELEERDLPKGRKKRKRILEADEVWRLIECSEDLGPLLIGVLFFAGLRISECLGLTWGDIDFQKGEIHVWKQLAKKPAEVTIGEHWCDLKGEGVDGAPKEKWVELPGVLRSLLLAHLGDRIPHSEDFVFTNREGRHQTMNNVDRRFKKATKAAGLARPGLPTLTPHQCRHNFASLLIASGNDVGYVCDQLGHSNPNITLGTYRSEFGKARQKGSGAAAIDAVYGGAVGL